MQPVEIVGGGLAGLALGVGLARAGVDVTVLEAGSYPRHRTCGEFIQGLDEIAVERLGIVNTLRDAPRRERVAWFTPRAQPKHWHLPQPALVVSRNELDQRLAAEFQAAGGRLMVGTTVSRKDMPPGRVFATGRRPEGRARWLGLKVHVANLPMTGDLELHVGQRGYVGLCALDRGRVNVCGLFRRDPHVRTRRTTGLSTHARAAGLSALADRLDRADVLPETFCAVAGLHFGRQAAPAHCPTLGDAYAVVPPYTGHGMALAFASAATAMAPLLKWSRRGATWSSTVNEICRLHDQRFSRRLRLAACLHPFLLAPAGVRLAAAAQRCGLIPFRRLCGWFR